MNGLDELRDLANIYDSISSETIKKCLDENQIIFENQLSRGIEAIKLLLHFKNAFANNETISKDSEVYQEFEAWFNKYFNET